MAGSIKKKSRDSLERLPHEGVSSNLGHRFKIERLPFILNFTEKRSAIFSKSGRRPPWPATQGSPESTGFPVSGHRFPRNQLQSNEELNANPSMRYKLATVDWTRHATRGGRWRHCRLVGDLQKRDSKPLHSKEKHGKVEKKIADSPTRRTRPQIHPRAPPISDRNLQLPPIPRARFHVVGLKF
jgi:hypothetical protein